MPTQCHSQARGNAEGCNMLLIRSVVRQPPPAPEPAAQGLREIAASRRHEPLGCRQTWAGLLVAFVLLSVSACGSNEGGSAGDSASSSSTTATTSTLPTTSGPMYDGMACQPLTGKTCSEASECCEAHLPCPGVFPDNWTCESGECKQGSCESNSDCLVPGFECLLVNEKASCVLPCEENGDCEKMAVKCLGQSDGVKKFCLEGPEDF